MDGGNIFIIFSLILTFSSASTIVDICVGDLKSPATPAGYPCKDPTTLTVDDFVYSGLGVAANTSNIFKASILAANDQTFPALNGLGLSVMRAYLEVGGVFPLHAHRVSEYLYVFEGTILSGFIKSDGKAFYKTLNKGDSMIIPHSLYHFSVNVGKTPANIFFGYNSQNPGIHVVSTSIGANDLPVDVIQKVTLLDPAQIQNLKKTFGGKA